MTRIKLFFVFLILPIIDQSTKYIIRTSGGFYICNTGLAFGIKPVYFFVITAIIILSAIIFTAGNLNNQNSKPFRICNFSNCDLFRIWNLEFGILLIIAGGISNLIDRVHFGCVIDFIDLKFWPVFNLADIYITIGGIIALYVVIFKQKQ